MTQKAYYFGARQSIGHYLYTKDHEIHHFVIEKNFPWTYAQMDSGFLEIWKIPDLPDGRVHWTYVNDWYIFCWWDRTKDHRPGSNSGFYVHGFSKDEQIIAFKFACSEFEDIVRRQCTRFGLQNIPFSTDILP